MLGLKNSIALLAETLKVWAGESSNNDNSKNVSALVDQEHKLIVAYCLINVWLYVFPHTSSLSKSQLQPRCLDFRIERQHRVFFCSSLVCGETFISAEILAQIRSGCLQWHWGKMLYFLCELRFIWANSLVW